MAVSKANQSIKQTMYCKYLEVTTANSKNLQQKARIQANQASRILESWGDIIWKNKHISTETRADNSKTKSIMKTAEIKTIRTIKKVTLRDQLRTTAIREELKLQDVVRFVRSRCRYWRDYVNRINENR